jgi:hypothetical protein
MLVDFISDLNLNYRGCYLHWNLDARGVLSMIWVPPRLYIYFAVEGSSSSDPSFLNLNPISLWSSSNAKVPSARFKSCVVSLKKLKSYFSAGLAASV